MRDKIFLVVRYLLAVICLFLGILGILIPIFPGWFFLLIALTLAFPLHSHFIIERLHEAKAAFKREYERLKKNGDQDNVGENNSHKHSQ